MAVYKIFPEKDTFIFSEIPAGNAGKDAILEIAGYPSTLGGGLTNRALLQFNTAEVSEVLDRIVAGKEYTASLHLYLATANEIPLDFNVHAYPIYSEKEWDAGKGKYGDSPADTSGVSWKYKNINPQNAWETGSFPQNVTASFQVGNAGGGNWYTAYGSASLEFTQNIKTDSTLDLDIDITPAIHLQKSGSIDNRGFIIKLSDDLEFNTTAAITLKYYGVDTNTVYPPSLDIKWDDSVYSTGSLEVLTTNQAIITLTNNKGSYVDKGKQRFRLAAKPTYPQRTFTTSSIYLKNYALPENSQWGLRDENTEEMVIPFNNTCTKISCDELGPFFEVYMDGLQPERYYRILVQTVLDGSTTVVDNQSIFKVIRNGQ